MPASAVTLSLALGFSAAAWAGNLPVTASKAATVAIDRMSGFEKMVEEAAREVCPHLTLVEPAESPRYRISLTPRFRYPAAARLHFAATGRSEDTLLELWETRTGKTLARHLFRMTGEPDGQRRAANAFLKTALRKLGPLR